MSTFLKDRDLAGLKVCSVSSSPSIVSVQSERGASCNSKLSHQSPPGPALKHQQRAQDGASPGHAAETAGHVTAAVMVGPRASTDHASGATAGPIRKTVTYPAVVFKVLGGNFIFRDNYLHDYLPCATKYSPFPEKRVNVETTFTGTLRKHFTPSSTLLQTAIYPRTKSPLNPPSSSIFPGILLKPGHIPVP